MAGTVINDFYSSEDYFFAFNLKYLFYVGLWPREEWSTRYLFYYKIYEVTLHILSFIYLIITGIGTYQHKDEITTFLSNLDLSLVAYNFVLKVIMFVIKRKQLRILITEIQYSGDKITEERKQLMATHVIFITVISTGIVGAFCALALFRGEMTVEAWMPFDPMKNGMNLLLAAQILAVTFVSCLYRSFAMQGIACSIIIYICDQLVELQERLRNMKYSPENETTMREEFKEIVRKHVRLIGYTKSMNIVFKEFFLIQNLAITVELCLNAMMVTVVGLEQKKRLASFVAFLAVALLNAYIYCYLGNQMIIESQGIALAAFEASWTTWPIDMQKNLLIVIRTAQNPLTLSAGGMATMSIQTFSQFSTSMDAGQQFAMGNIDFCKIIVFIVSELYARIVDFLNWARTGEAIALIIAAVVFLIGIFVNLLITCMIFEIICLTLCTIKLVTLIMNFIGILFMTYSGTCSKSKTKAMSMEFVNLGQAFLMFYFAIVANSYIMDEITSNGS